MLFNSLDFLIFFAVVLALHNLPFSWTAKKRNLLVASYLFYAAWNPPFVVLIWISTLTDWWAARRMHHAAGPTARRCWLALSLGVNLGLLGFFKYGEFLTQNFAALVQRAGVAYVPAEWSIVLPVGISFYTFQTLSYTLDVYRRDIEPCDSPLDFALFVTFFPQLVAGPIVRAADFLPQCRNPRRATQRQLSWGLSILVIGLFQKVFIADGLMAPVVETVYGAVSTPGFVDAWAGTLAFSVQIFSDFSGYSCCAIGAGLCLGFAIPDNFRYPYAAIGFSDFWRRWHISLSTWLRDYLYISLGGNRKGHRRMLVNLMATMLLGGLWHGASWTFVAWGGLHGLFLVLERGLKALVPRSVLWDYGPVRFVLAVATFLLVTVAWVFFRADSFGQAYAFIASMCGLTGGTGAALLAKRDLAIVGAVVLTLLTQHWLMRGTTVEALFDRMPWWLRALPLAACLTAVLSTSGTGHAFIYFQF
jgi:alginate O-acetyltransferase complex protein AlgI